MEPAEPAGGSEQERSTYICNKRQQILRLVGRWVALYSTMLASDPVATSFLQVPGPNAGMAWLAREGAPAAIPQLTLGSSPETLRPGEQRCPT